MYSRRGSQVTCDGWLVDNSPRIDVLIQGSGDLHAENVSKSPGTHSTR